MRSRTLTVVGAVVVLALVVAGSIAVLRGLGAIGGPDGDLAVAADASPGDAQRLSFTDWAGVREELDADLDARSTGADVRSFLDRGFRSDLTSTSAMVASAAALQEQYGVSPGTVEWEGFAQSTSGAVVTMRLTDGEEVEELGQRLGDLGYTAPEGDDGVWDGGADLLAGIDSALSPVFGYAVLLTEESLVLTSDSPGYLATARAAALGDEPSLYDEVGDVVDPVPDALSAAVYTGEYACGQLAMNRADERAQASADRLIEDAGDVSPLTSFAMARVVGGDARTVLGFTDDDTARGDADARAVLASGPAPGQGGTFGERFELTEASAEGSAVVLDMAPRRRQLVVSDLSAGPLLFAAC